MAWHQNEFYFTRTESLSREAMQRGDDAFACVLVDANGNILLEESNRAESEKDPTAHDVMVLVRQAVRVYSPKFLETCTLYALMEPCVMCMGAIFWANIRRVKFAMSEADMNRILPGGLEIHSQEFAERCPKSISVEGPFPQFTQAPVIVREWIHSLGIPGIPAEE